MRSRTKIESSFLTDRGGNPMGGYTKGVGIYIAWQNGRIGEKGHNGAFVEDTEE